MVVVHRASQPGQLVLRGTVADIAEQVELAGLRQAAVILVGRALDPRDPAQSFLYDPARDRSSATGPMAYDADPVGRDHRVATGTRLEARSPEPPARRLQRT